MLIHLEKVLDAEQVRSCRALLDGTEWVDGRQTAGAQAAEAKRNSQLPYFSETAQALRDIVLSALKGNLTFRSAVLPQEISPPGFNRYDPGMYYETHVDNAVQVLPNGATMRADISMTLFLNDPGEYDGGELEMFSQSGIESIKLEAGDAIIYPTTVVHRVSEVTRGTRLASFFWIQSLVRDPAKRELLFDMDRTIIDLRGRLPHGDQAILALTNAYHNLLREWCFA